MSEEKDTSSTTTVTTTTTTPPAAKKHKLDEVVAKIAAFVPCFPYYNSLAQVSKAWNTEIKNQWKAVETISFYHTQSSMKKTSPMIQAISHCSTALKTIIFHSTKVKLLGKLFAMKQLKTVENVIFVGIPDVSKGTFESMVSVLPASVKRIAFYGCKIKSANVEETLANAHKASKKSLKAELVWCDYQPPMIKPPKTPDAKKSTKGKSPRKKRKTEDEETPAAAEDAEKPADSSATATAAATTGESSTPPAEADAMPAASKAVSDQPSIVPAPDWLQRTLLSEIGKDATNDTAVVKYLIRSLGTNPETDILNEHDTLLSLIAKHGAATTMQCALGGFRKPSVDLVGFAIANNTAHAHDVSRVLIDAGVDISATFTDATLQAIAERPVLLAAKRGVLDVMKALLAIPGVDQYQKDSTSGNTSLHLACEEANEAIVDYLITERSQTLEQLNNNSQTCLHVLLHSLNFDTEKALRVIEVLSRNAGFAKLLRATDSNGNTALHLAAQANAGPVVNRLLAACGADKQQQAIEVLRANNAGLTPAHALCSTANPIATADAATIVDTINALVSAAPAVITQHVTLTEHNEEEEQPKPKQKKASRKKAAEEEEKVEKEDKMDVDSADTTKTSSEAAPKTEQEPESSIPVIRTYVSTLVHEACKLPNAATLVKRLLEVNPAAANALDGQQHTPLHIACQQKDVKELALALIHHGANVDAKDAKGYFPLIYALQNPASNAADLLLEAAISRHSTAAAAGAKTIDDLRDESGRTLLHICAEHPENSKFVESLITKAKCDVNTTDSTGAVPLLVALKADNVRCARAILDTCKSAGIALNTNIKSNSGLYPLIAAMQMPLPNKRADQDALYDLVESLIRDFDTDVTIRDEEDEKDRPTALYVACENNMTEDIVTAMLDKGADPNAPTLDTQLVPLFSCAENGFTDLTDVLLDYGANQMLADKTHSIPLIYALAQGDVDSVELFLENLASTTEQQVKLLVENLTATQIDVLLVECARRNMNIDLVKEILIYRTQLVLGKVTPVSVYRPVKIDRKKKLEELEAQAKAKKAAKAKSPKKKKAEAESTDDTKMDVDEKKPEPESFTTTTEPTPAAPAPAPTPLVPVPESHARSASSKVTKLYKDVDEKHRSLIHYICHEGYLDLIVEYVEWAKLVYFAKDDAEKDAIEAEMKASETEIKRSTLFDIIINDGDDDQNTPLHYCAMRHEANHRCEPYMKDSIGKYLIDKGALVNAKNDDGDTPLHIACRYGYKLLAKSLINAGADIQALNKKKQTCTEIASAYGNYSMTFNVETPTKRSRASKSPRKVKEEGTPRRSKRLREIKDEESQESGSESESEAEVSTRRRSTRASSKSPAKSKAKSKSPASKSKRVTKTKSPRTASKSKPRKHKDEDDEEESQASDEEVERKKSKSKSKGKAKSKSSKKRKEHSDESEASEEESTKKKSSKKKDKKRKRKEAKEEESASEAEETEPKKESKKKRKQETPAEDSKEDTNGDSKAKQPETKANDDAAQPAAEQPKTQQDEAPAVAASAAQ